MNTNLPSPKVAAATLSLTASCAGSMNRESVS